MPWKPGQSGNPAGRKPGSRNRTGRLLETLLEEKAEEVIRKVLELSLQGNGQLLKMLFERLAPSRRGRTVELDLGPIANTRDLAEAQLKVLQALSAAIISAEEAAAMSKVIDSTRVALRARELVEEEERERERLESEPAARQIAERSAALDEMFANRNRQSLI